MNAETINATYETITNPILRLMLYMLAAAVVALCGVVGFLYRQNQVLQREIINSNIAAIGAMNNIADVIEAMQNDIANKSKAPQP